MPATSPAPMSPADDIASLWLAAKRQVDMAKQAEGQLRLELQDRLRTDGVETENGSLVMGLPERVTFGKNTYSAVRLERVVAEYADEEVAEHITRSKGVYERAFPVRPVFDPQELYVLNSEDILSDVDMGNIFLSKESWRTVRVKD
ncbi:hypothetical protein [Streptomyces sp. NBC_00470]|uniref:hypothetical protein n=1 Tax=Streptomyces sp. NBC_00470 TaxID=2975753 RepID=UPI0030DEFA7E